MNIAEEDWEWNDGWILMSIFLKQEKDCANLTNILAAADALNHAIPTPEELSSAFTKLVNYGIIFISDDVITINEEYKSDINAAYQKKGGLFKTGQNGLDWLRKANLNKRNTKTVKITNTEVKNAYDEYVSRIGI